MAEQRFTDDQAGWDKFWADTELSAVQIVTGRVAGATRTLMPTADFARYPRPGYTRRNLAGDSRDPGATRRSVHATYRRNVYGQTVGQVRILWTYGFYRKRRHGIYAAHATALRMQYGRSVP